MAAKSNTEEFIKKAKAKFGDRYDYSQVEYVGKNVPVKIGCKIHGWFYQTPHTHLSKKTNGCPKCAEEIRRNKRALGREEFIAKAKEIHGDKYDYSKVEYKNNSTDVTIICPIHGEFQQAPGNHLSGKGCWKCGRVSSANKNKSNTEEFIKKSREIHGDKYDYSKVNYINNSTLVTIICPIHGEVQQLPSVHLTSSGCPKCGRLLNDEARKLTTEQFIERAKKRHGDRYSYEKSVYVRHDVPIIVTCPEHGDFELTPDAHTQGRGCPTCTKINPLEETDIYNYVCNLIGEGKVQKHVVGILNGKQEIDIYTPDMKIGIEHNGLIWHSERFRKDKLYHISKTNICVRKGINLIHVFEDEYLYKRQLVYDKINEALHIDANKENLLPSQYSLKEISSKEAQEFYKEYSLESYTRSTVHIGAYTFKNELIAVLSATKVKNGIKVNHLIKHYKYKPIDIEKRMFDYIIEKYNPNYITWVLDRRWYSLGSKELLDIGFKSGNVTKPNVYYTNKKFRLTESEMKQSTSKAQFYKIYDSGNLLYEWKKNGSGN